MRASRERPSGIAREPSVSRRVAVLVGALVALALAACGASAARTSNSSARAAAAAAPATEPACGGAAAQTAAAAAGLVARRIYDQELSSSEVRADRRQVEGFQPLLSALARGERGGVREAVTSLVFSHTHVVRLRVSRGGEVLADVGGPYILAPVSGSLRLNGRTVGRYTLSVQDDLGYVKLENRFIGYPLILRQGSGRVPVEGTASGSVPRAGAYRYHGRSYQVVSFRAQAFPSGALEISLLVPTPGSSRPSCSAIRVAQLAQISRRVWNRFRLVSAPVSSYVVNLFGLTGALSYVRAGSHQLAGSTSPGPPRLPDAGTVSYRHATYRVRSFPARVGGESVRVYLLIAP